jgi:hypothetical protein
VSESYSAVLAQIAALANKFDAESDTLNAVMPTSGPSAVDAGQDAINESLSAILEAAGALNAQLAALVGAHGIKLKQAHDRYQSTEESITKLCTDLTDSAKLG